MYLLSRRPLGQGCGVYVSRTSTSPQLGFGRDSHLATFPTYDPRRDERLVVTLERTPSRGLNYRSEMRQSRNEICFTGGYKEVLLSLRGANGDASGYAP